MKAVVVYESLYGNTGAVAEAVAEGLGERAEVTLLPVAEADAAALAEADIVVVGGPTHVHGMASKRSREGAVADAEKHGLAPPDVSGPGLAEWFAAVADGGGRPAASFDTRIGKPKFLTGSAAKGIAHRLEQHGYRVVGSESFTVAGTAGPLQAGEAERASAWARGLIAG